MKRRLFNILSALSLLLFMVTMALWILNIWVEPAWSYHGENGGPYVAIVPSHGYIEVGYMEVGYMPLLLKGQKPTGFHEFAADEVADDFRWNHLGFDGNLQNLTIAPGPLWFTIPDWFICLVTAVLPFRWYRSYRRRRLAARMGLCLTCGYDLRASNERCPECGTPVVATEVVK